MAKPWRKRDISLHIDMVKCLFQIMIWIPPNMVASMLLMVPAPVTVPAPMIPEQMCRCQYRGVNMGWKTDTGIGTGAGVKSPLVLMNELFSNIPELRRKVWLVKLRLVVIGFSTRNKSYGRAFPIAQRAHNLLLLSSALPTYCIDVPLRLG